MHDFALSILVQLHVLLHDDLVEQLEAVKLLMCLVLLWSCFDDLLDLVNRCLLDFERGARRFCTRVDDLLAEFLIHVVTTNAGENQLTHVFVAFNFRIRH